MENCDFFFQKSEFIISEMPTYFLLLYILFSNKKYTVLTTAEIRPQKPYKLVEIVLLEKL